MKITINKKNGRCFGWAAAALMLAASFIFTGCPQPTTGGNSGGGTGSGGKVLIKYDNATIEVWAKKADNQWDVIAPDSEVPAGTELFFNAKAIPAGQQVDKWKVNTKELRGAGYTVNAADAVTEGSNQVITITYTLK